MILIEGEKIMQKLKLLMTVAVSVALASVSALSFGRVVVVEKRAVVHKTYQSPGFGAGKTVIVKTPVKVVHPRRVEKVEVYRAR